MTHVGETVTDHITLLTETRGVFKGIPDIDFEISSGMYFGGNVNPMKRALRCAIEHGDIDAGNFGKTLGEVHGGRTDISPEVMLSEHEEAVGQYLE